MGKYIWLKVTSVFWNKWVLFGFDMKKIIKKNETMKTVREILIMTRLFDNVKKLAFQVDVVI